MAILPKSEALVPQDKLPDELYISFVERLLDDVVPMLFSALAVTIAQIVIGLAAQSKTLLLFSSAQMFVCALRLYFLSLQARSRGSLTVEKARHFELRYALGTVLSLGAISLWTLTAFCVSDSAFVRFLSAVMTIAFPFGMLSRSFAIYRGINYQLLAAFLPLTAAMIVAGGWYPSAIFVGFIPLALFMKGSSERLRANFLAVVSAQQRASLLASRLDTALNNMSHGLCMVDGRGRLILANDQVLRIFGLQPEDAQAGAHMRGVFRRLVKKGMIAHSQFVHLSKALFRRVGSEDLVVPLETRDDRAIEITAHRMEGEGTVVVVQDVTERRNAQREIDRIARTDTVTDLPNRRYFEGQLARALDPDDPLRQEITVLFLDLDDFKQVNDSLGHRRGDKLLITIAQRIQALVGPADLVARWGGDEFTILIRGPFDHEQTGRLAERIIREVRRPAIIDGYEVVVGVSVGSASAPVDGLTADIILSNADIALYAAKLDGRGTWRSFEKSMDAKIQIRRLIELDLRSAIENEAIDVYYQPIVNVATRKVVSFEALVRWNHPVKGRMSPTEFIPIVEEIGLMETMGASVLKRACKACASWPDNVCVSVNLSSTQFRSGRLEQTIVDALEAANLPPDRLELEITESTLLDDRGGTREMLDALRRRGVRISLDDFGTGYSSLSYLLSFPLDRIKIDRSFTVGLGFHERSSILVESVALMSAKLGMSVLIEGVETEGQLRFIERLGTIAEVQGFLFSPAVPEAEARKLIGAGKRQNAAA